MANESEFIEVLSGTTLSDVEKLNALLLQTVGNIDKINAKGIKTPSGSAGAVTDYNAQLAIMSKQISDLQAKNVALAAAQKNNITVTNTGTGALGKNTTAARQNTAAKQILNAEENRNFRANTLLAGAYAKASAQLLILKKNAKDYAISLGETHPKTLQAIKDANDLSGRINAADNAVGDFQRNVGNYSNGVTKGIGALFSGVRQLAYLLPGIGIAGIFSLALDPLLELIKTLDVFKKELTTFRDINKEARISATGEIEKVRGLLEVAKDVTLTYKERKIAVDELQKTYPFYFENLTKEQIMAGETAQAENALTEAILSRAKANAAIGKITENQGKIIDDEVKIYEARKRLADANKELADNEKLQSQVVGGGTAMGTGGSGDREIAIAGRIANAKKEIAKAQKEINDLEALNNVLSRYSYEQAKKAIGLDYNPTKDKEKKDAKRKDLEAIKMENEGIDGTIKRLEAQAKIIQELQQSAQSFEQWKAFQDILDGINKTIKFIKEGSEELRESAKKGTDEAKAKNDLYLEELKRLAELRAATEKYIASVANSSLGDLGMGSLQQFFDGTFDRLLAGADTLKEKFAVTFKAIGDVAVEAFAMIEQLQQRQFQQQYDRLEQEKRVAISFAGESAGAREEIERQYDERRRQIQRQQAEAEKRSALFNILIKTAQGVVAALASLNIPLAITIGVIGAAQAAIVASQPIPEFKTGLEAGEHKGGLMKVNDGSGSDYREKVILPSGRVLEPIGRNVIMNTPKGTRVATKSQWDSLMFNNELNGILSSNGIGQTAGAPKYVGLTKQDMIEVLQTIPQGDSFSAVYDERGLSLYKSNQNSSQQLMNSRKHITGKNIGRG